MNKIFFTTLIVCLFSTSVYAQEGKEKVRPSFLEDKYAGIYQKSSVANLSRLYWAKGGLDIENDKVIDNFVLINDCDLYQKHVQDDFYWEKVRAATRDYINEHIQDYSDKFKIIVPLDLGRYDYERQGFHLVNYTELNKMKRVKIGEKDIVICGTSDTIAHYPRHTVLVLNKPYTLDFIELEEELAKTFLEYYNRERPIIPGEFIRYERYERPVFARVRMRFLELQGTQQEKYSSPHAVMFGRIDGIDIFQYADEKGLIKSITYYEPDEKVGREKNRVKKQEANSNTELIAAEKETTSSEVKEQVEN